MGKPIYNISTRLLLIIPINSAYKLIFEADRSFKKNGRLSIESSSVSLCVKRRHPLPFSSYSAVLSSMDASLAAFLIPSSTDVGRSVDKHPQPISH